jgi:PDZ domain-containing protein
VQLNSDLVPRKASRVRKRIGLVLLGFGTLAITGAFLTPAPYVIESPGPVFDVLGKLDDHQIITVTGAKTYKTSDQLDALTVNERGTPDDRPSWGEVAAAWLNPDQVLVPIEKMFGPSTTTDQVNQMVTKMMLDSQRDAVAVALTKSGVKFESWISVDAIKKGSPSAGVFKPDDVIVSVAGVKPKSLEQMPSIIDALNGEKVAIEVKRAGKLVFAQVTPVKDEASGKWRVGMFISYRYKFPFKVKVDLGNVSGPSAGMMFTLGIIDKLGPDNLTGGYHIAGTGTIDADGKVGPIGGIQLKMKGASRAGAKFFLAPRSNCDEILGHIPAGMQVVTVDNINDALRALEPLQAGKSLPTSTPLGCKVP